MKIGILLALLLLIPISAFSEVGSLWEMHPKNNRILYFAHGSNVWGHQFGFIKTANHCVPDVLWLEWSASSEKVKDFKGQEAEFKIVSGDSQFEFKTSMLLSKPLTPLTQRMIFSNYVMNEKMAALLKKSKNVKVSIVGPAALMENLDIQEENFEIEGFEEAQAKAQTACEEL